MNNLKIDINLLSKLSYEELLSLYKQGYTIDEGKSGQYNLKSLATCPLSIPQGTLKTLMISPTGGMLPYTKLELLVDGLPVKSLVGSYTAATSITYDFPESIGNHIYSSRTTDSCSPPQIVTDISPCTINITSPTSSLCTWIVSPSNLTIPQIITLVNSYLGLGNVGFAVTIPQIMGVVYYYMGLTSSGNTMTGCNF